MTITLVVVDDQAAVRDALAVMLDLAAFDDDESILAALQAGASGYLTKEADRATILHTVRSASYGRPCSLPWYSVGFSP